MNTPVVHSMENDPSEQMQMYIDNPYATLNLVNHTRTNSSLICTLFLRGSLIYTLKQRFYFFFLNFSNPYYRISET